MMGMCASNFVAKQHGTVCTFIVFDRTKCSFERGYPPTLPDLPVFKSHDFEVWCRGIRRYYHQSMTAALPRHNSHFIWMWFYCSSWLIATENHLRCNGTIKIHPTSTTLSNKRRFKWPHTAYVPAFFAGVTRATHFPHFPRALRADSGGLVLEFLVPWAISSNKLVNFTRNVLRFSGIFVCQHEFVCMSPNSIKFANYVVCARTRRTHPKKTKKNGIFADTFQVRAGFYLHAIVNKLADKSLFGPRPFVYLSMVISHLGCVLLLLSGWVSRIPGRAGGGRDRPSTVLTLTLTGWVSVRLSEF